MRSYVASAVLAAAFVLAPAATGYAPALSQDFSITNVTPGGSEWIRQLQAWWDIHAYYPKEASEKNEDGTVKVHLVIHPDGEVWTVEVVQKSGSKFLDEAGFNAFHNALLRPLPPVPPVPQSDVFITEHYVLTHRQAGNAPASSKRPFTITDDPVHDTVADTMLQRTCTGTAVPLWWSMLPTSRVQAIFYRKPDGTKWVKFTLGSRSPNDLPVTEIGMSAQWKDFPVTVAQIVRDTHYDVWPQGDNRISGSTVEPWGTIELTCGPERSEQPGQ